VPQPNNEKIEKVFDRSARHYDRMMGVFERVLFAGSRAWAVSNAHGQLVEIAVGTGLNLPLYGPAVGHVIGVDLSEGMLEVARQRVADEHLDGVALRHGDVQALDLPDGCAD